MYKFSIAPSEDIEELVKIRLLEQENDWKGLRIISEKNFADLAYETYKAFKERLNKDLIMFIIKKNNVIVAQAGLLIQHYLPQVDNLNGIRGYLTNVYTIKHERRKHLQLYLSDEIIKYAKHNGIERIDLHATPKKEIFLMYKKLGYKFFDNNARLYIDDYIANNVNLIDRSD